MKSIFIILFILLFFTSGCSSPGRDYTFLKNIEEAKTNCSNNNFPYDPETGVKTSFNRYVLCFWKQKEISVKSVYANRLLQAGADLEYKIKTDQITDGQAIIQWNNFHSHLLAAEEKIKDEKSYQKRLAILQIFAGALSQYGKDIQNAYSKGNTYNTGSKNSYDDRYYTGGPLFDWDIFANGQYRCRTISNGQFAEDILCDYMPLDDDRWPG